MAAEQTPRDDPTTAAIALVTETMQGGAPVTAEVAEPAVEIVLQPLRERLQRPDRPLFSDSESAGRYSQHVSKRYKHEIWAPDKRHDGSEEPGHLTITAYLDEKGHIDPYDNAYDRYHYRTAANLANLANMGLRQLMEYLGIVVDVRLSDLYYNRYCNIRVDFPSSQTLHERANPLLLRHAAARGTKPVQFVGTGKGAYPSELYLSHAERGEYLLAEEYGTPQQTLSTIDEGTHDVLTHALAVILVSGTHAADHLVQEAEKTIGWIDQPTREGAAKSILGDFMRRADIGLSLPAFVGALQGEEKGLTDFRLLFGPQSGSFLEQIRKNATTPHETGLWIP